MEKVRANTFEKVCSGEFEDQGLDTDAVNSICIGVIPVDNRHFMAMAMLFQVEFLKRFMIIIVHAANNVTIFLNTLLDSGLNIACDRHKVFIHPKMLQQDKITGSFRIEPIPAT